MTHEAHALAQKHGGVWGKHPNYIVADWQYEVTNNYTRLGYWDWVLNRIWQEEDE